MFCLLKLILDLFIFSFPGVLFCLFIPQDLQLWGFALNALSFGIVAMVWTLDTTLDSVGKFTIVVFLRAMSRVGATTTTFVMPSQLFAAEVRSTVNGFCAAWGKTGAIIATVVTPIMYEDYGFYSVFFLYAAVAALGWAVTYLFIPYIDQDAKAAAVQNETRVKEQRRGAETVPLVGGTLNQMRSHVSHGE
jgi:PHS family inorganic phosphate transporter-like MFS transporter